VPQVDVWSLGMCAVEMGDGKPPFWDLAPIQVALCACVHVIVLTSVMM
jgi:hypothetical protein